MYKKKSDLPESLRQHLPDELQEIYLEAYQKSWEEYEEEEGGELGREGVAHRDGMMAVQLDYVHDDDTGEWRRKEESPEQEGEEESGDLHNSQN